jgi:hypothetical protein
MMMVKHTINYRFHPANPFWQRVFTEIGRYEYVFHHQPDVHRASRLLPEFFLETRRDIYNGTERDPRLGSQREMAPSKWFLEILEC